jgi:hypothetical protein
MSSHFDVQIGFVQLLNNSTVHFVHLVCQRLLMSIESEFCRERLWLMCSCSKLLVENRDEQSQVTYAYV